VHSLFFYIFIFLYFYILYILYFIFYYINFFSLLFNTGVQGAIQQGGSFLFSFLVGVLKDECAKTYNIAPEDCQKDAVQEGGEGSERPNRIRRWHII
jgi:hypothetical protein